MTEKITSGLKKIEWELKLILFKISIVASRVDNSISSDEQRYLSHLIEILAKDEDERNNLRELKHQGLKKDSVLTGKYAEAENGYEFCLLQRCLYSGTV